MTTITATSRRARSQAKIIPTIVLVIGAIYCLRAIHLTGPMQVRRLSMVEPLVACPWSAGGPAFPAVRAGSASAGGRRPGRGSALERGRRPVRARGRRPCRGCEIGVG